MMEERMAEKRTALQVDMERIKSELHQTNLDEDAGTPSTSPNGSQAERLDAPEQSTPEHGGSRRFRFTDEHARTWKVVLDEGQQASEDLQSAVAGVLRVVPASVHAITYTDEDGDNVDLMASSNMDWVMRHVPPSRVVEITVSCNHAASSDGQAATSDAQPAEAAPPDQHKHWRQRQRDRQRELASTTLQERRERAQLEKQQMAERQEQA